MKNSTYIEKKWMQFKVSTLSASITALVIAGIPNLSTASDIDIYQAGGTGNVNIYFMLDTSGSMGSMSLDEDYKYKASKKSLMCQPMSASGRNYTKSANGNRWVIFQSVTLGTGAYTKEGDDYIFVGGGGGYNKIKEENYYYNNSILYTRSSQFTVDYKSCENTDEICYSENGYTAEKNVIPLQINGYTYVPSGEKYCLIKESFLNINNTNDNNYLKKIKSICEPNRVSGEYRCLTRMANLKKGLLSLINSDSSDETKYFAIGQYSGSSSSNLTSPTFLPMNATNKAIISSKIEALSADGGTPIGNGYERATNQITSSTSGANNTKPECTGNGIYLLTDGEPSDSNAYSDWGSSRPTGVTQAQFDQLRNDFWKSLGRKARANLSSDRTIKSATVGFGGMYYLDTTYAKDGNFECNVYLNGTNATNQSSLCYSGTKKSVFGQGGFYNAQSAEDIVSSINQFVGDVSKTVEGSTMGASTIPVDPLNSTQLQRYSYFPMFKPLINTDDQLWAGNLKKFKIDTTSGTIIDQKNKTIFEGDNIRDSLEDYWYESAGSSSDDKKMAWGGLLSKLKVHNKPTLLSSGSIQSFNRELYINQDGQLKKVTEVLSSTTRPANAQYLYGLLGYSKLAAADFAALSSKSYNDQLIYLKDKSNLQNYQMGSVIHSTPIMLTQEGSFGYDGDNYVSKGRKDYILAGTTQGLVQVVDAESGKEVFSFLPAEFLNGTSNQAKGFAESLAMDRRTDATKDQFFYGVDGPWVAYSEYKNKFNITTNSTTNTTTETESLVASKQYVYGGLRMGGKSYYGLDLTKLGSTVANEKPTMLFHIDPVKAAANSPLSFMGQSWSKPTVTYIRWNGQKKLAMIVGGGYDPQYEDPAFVSSTTKPVKGNGIYIFDALNGDLLWWSSSNAPESAVTQATITDNRVTAPESNQISDMKHSIPSRIKAVDRDGDGVTDHLYVADLGGQLFRVDLNAKHKITSTASEKQPFVLNAFKLADMNDTNGKRRFYEPPTFTIHKDGGKRFAVLALSSGDRSNPLKTATNAPSDVVIAIEDHGVTQNPPVKPNITLSDLHNLSGASSRLDTAKGWYYPTVISETRIKGDKSETLTLKLRGFEPGIALDNDLYFSLFNPDKSTADTANVTSCTGGVTGESTAYKFCLPYGICSATVKGPLKVGSLGPGILGLTLGPGRSSETNRTLIFNKATSPVPPEYTVTDKLVPRRWYEYLPYKSGS